MESENIEILSDAIKEYFGDYEFDELCSRFGLKIEYQGSNPNRKKLVTELVNRKYRSNNRRFLETILSKLLQRCEERILNSTWEVNIFDEQMLPHLKALQHFAVGKKKSVQQTQSLNLLFTTKEQIINFLSSAKTVLMIVDTEIGKTTFDCIQKVQTPVRLLTRQSHQELADNAAVYIDFFRQDDHEIDIRRHLKLNDRFIIFNGHCWLVNRSLVDLGKETISIIECVDTQSVVVKEIGRKWREAKVYTN
ncbi:hypothetical protein D1AOALGA4SA_9268 [Olavius algarvensis Delta 1 endosymbiont]|nr:hypothetical protein D1AOALGA4SA_9268 [Olavius algarvensis Delta 1 endosymbiont]